MSKLKSLAVAAIVAIGTIAYTADSYAGGRHGGGGGWRGGGGHAWNGGRGYYRGGGWGGRGIGLGIAAGVLGGVAAGLAGGYAYGYPYGGYGYAPAPYACYPNGYCGGVPRYYYPPY